MRVEKKDGELNTKNVYLIDEDKTLIFIFGANLDLYWVINKDSINSDECSYEYFDITQENYEIYSLFEELIQDIKDINIFGREEPISSYDKKRYKTSNLSNYNNLYNAKTNTITWISDETNYKVANILKIRKINDIFRIEFFTQPYIEGYDREYNVLGRIAIRFRNSGSRYEPFNVVFMRMFNQLQNVDDIKDIGHQIHIGEYLYQKEQKSLSAKILKK